MKERIAKSVFWIVWSKGGVQVISLISTLAVARLLAPSDYGLIALATAWVFPMSLVAEMGLGAAVLQYRDLTDQEMNLCFWTVAGIGLLLYAFLCLLAPPIGEWFNTPQVVPVLRVAGLALPCIALRAIPDGLLRKNLTLDKIAQAELIASMMVIPTTLVLAILGGGVWALVVGVVMLPFIQTIATFVFCPWKPTFKCGSTRMRHIFNYSFSTLGAKVCWATYRQADLFVLGKVSGDVALGVYSLAKQLATLPSEKISTVVNQIAWPVMAHLQDDREQMGASLIRGIRLVACLTFPICTGLLLTSEELVAVLLTDKWNQAVLALRVLCAYGAIRSLDIMLPAVLMARFRARFMFLYSGTLLLVMPVAFWVGAQISGAVGVASVWVLVYPGIMMMMAHEALKEVSVTWRHLWRSVWPVFAATLAMAVVILVLKHGLSEWPVAFGVAKLSMTVLAGCLVYSGFLFSIDRQMWREVREIASWMLLRSPVKRVQEQTV